MNPKHLGASSKPTPSFVFSSLTWEMYLLIINTVSPSHSSDKREMSKSKNEGNKVYNNKGRRLDTRLDLSSPKIHRNTKKKRQGSKTFWKGESRRECWTQKRKPVAKT
eukprot:TRINITY_DN5370_c0_g1_i1.p2 TRINITY_DN5370_c0_g1~~TRINITY_DN5370_c0_g1_i1.p2  ORF type:complete len:108 (+),score=8.97 TRINITY_DN5370_c0_g1_i1:804-1127(+)